MSASINLLPRKEFEIILEDGTIIKGKFGTWALRRFCDRNKYSLQQASEQLSAANMGVGDILDYILCAVEYSARKAQLPFSYTDVDCGAWLDELGGIKADGDVIRLFNHSASEDATVTEEKKTDS